MFIARIPMKESTRAKLARVQAVYAHVVPSGDLEALFEVMLDDCLELREGKKRAAVKRARPARAVSERSRRIPAAVRREVWARDDGRCAFTSGSGRRCGWQRGLEYDHEVPFARGGESTVGNVRLRCRAHNQYEADQAFGVGFMQAKRAREGMRKPAPGS